MSRPSPNRRFSKFHPSSFSGLSLKVERTSRPTHHVCVVPYVDKSFRVVMTFDTGPRGKRIFSASFCELTDTRLGKEESAAADQML
jgi:hypothetical protein